MHSYQHLQLRVDNPWITTNAQLGSSQTAQSHTAHCKLEMKQKPVAPRSVNQQPCIKTSASLKCLQESIWLVRTIFLIVINTYSIILVLGTNRLQELIQKTRMCNLQRQTIALSMSCFDVYCLWSSLLKQGASDVLLGSKMKC